MVKSPSCFKIITCGSDSAEKDDLEVAEGKNSSDKRRWSFRKRSARHRVLSNTVTTEAPTFGNKDVSESATLNFESQADTTVQDKISVVHCIDEKPQLATVLKTELPDTVVKPEVPDTVVKLEVPDTVTVVKPKVPDTVVKPEVPEDVVVEQEVPEVVIKQVPEVVVKPEVPDLAVNEEIPETLLKPEVPDPVVTIEGEYVRDAKIDESSVIVIQAAARGFLARREKLKLKKLIKLQAAVRGHIVRRHAGGTLRCVQAIVKMQALVRARHARLSLEGSCQKSDGKGEEDLVKKSSGLNTSIEKLLGNRFARQILESSPKTKPIHVKCDPSKSDSAWKWLERWMSVSAVNAVESKQVVAVTEDLEEHEEEKFDAQLETKIQSDVISESVDSKCNSVPESIVPSESEDNLITYEADKFDFQACHYTTSTKDNLERSEPENTSISDVREPSEDINSPQTQNLQAHVVSETEHDYLSVEPEKEVEQSKRSMKRLASEELETEGTKYSYGSKKVTSPSFIAAQSKLEELSSSVNSDQTLSSSYQEVADESHQDATLSEAQSLMRTKEISVAESPVHGSRAQIGGSECGTELSVTSTLDSPDRSDVGVMEHEPEPVVPEEEISNHNNMAKNLDLEAKDVPTAAESYLSTLNPDQPEKLDVTNCESVASVVSVSSPQIELNPEKYDLQRKQKSGRVDHARVVSPEASPRSYTTGAESQGTPASQVSVKKGNKKSDKSGSDRKRASLSAVKKSPSNTNNDSGSVEKLPKEQKNGKKRTFFGSPKPENGEQEPRDSSSSNNSIPHFMQATESARAKLNANSSPRSSPDVQDRDNYIKKRHSLPGANGRQGSPRVQRSTSEAQQGAKGTERKWQR